MKKITATVMGFGDRGQIYARYAKMRPDLFEIVGVVDPNPVKLEKAKREYNLKTENCYSDPAEFYRKSRQCDAVINATMDRLHYETTPPLLEKGYHVLLEKPVASDPRELLDLERAAKENRRVLMVCHVLRYAPFYRRIKELLAKGAIGRIKHIYACENVAVYHMLSAYVRGKWSAENACGSGMLMAKCCHDLDLLVWLNAGAKPVTVASVGVRGEFTAKNKPAGAGTRCLSDCAAEDSCPYSARKLYIKNDVYPFLIWNDLPGRDWDGVELPLREKLLKTVSPHGECAFADKDLVDSQSTLVTFDNGSTATLDMLGGVSRPGRNMHIVGSTGEIEGFLESNRFAVRRYDADSTGYKEETREITEDVSGAHSGGDLRLVEDFVSMLSDGPRSVSCTDISDSVIGHLLAIAAEKSRKENRMVSFADFFL
ncbi:MAG: Gfo/Idh/MocA family oxidoreductase [Clostridiales bacterium]|jgi:predicted dehydrogenase|nr:Gfo/Idh/MocA family oxidoreductase [Clostridiales bacterium]